MSDSLVNQLARVLGAVQLGATRIWSWFTRYAEDILDFIISVAFFVPGYCLLTGIKPIPNIVLDSVASVIFSYFWVVILFVGGLMFLVGVLSRYEYPTLSWAGEYIGLLALAFSVMIYGISACITFGFFPALLTLSICIAYAAFALKMWLPRKSFLSYVAKKYDAKGEEVCPEEDKP